MSKQVFSSCCGCMSLRTGSLIIGYLEAIGSLLVIIYGITILAGLQKDIDELMGVIIGIIFTAAGGINFIFVALLIVGAHTGNPSCLQGYIILTYVKLVLSAISIIPNPFSALITIPSMALEIYFVLVVRSHKQELESPPAKDVLAKENLHRHHKGVRIGNVALMA